MTKTSAAGVCHHFVNLYLLVKIVLLLYRKIIYLKF